MEGGAYRLRSRAKGRTVNFRTGTSNLHEAKRRAKEYLIQRANDPIHSRKGGGTLEALITVYRATPKPISERSQGTVISRMRSVGRVVTGKECDKIGCREIGPAFWQAYLKKKVEGLGRPFEYATRHIENPRINAAVRSACGLFTPALISTYRAAGLSVSDDAARSTLLPEPWLPPSPVDEDAILKAWRTLDHSSPLWLALGLARFAGLRRDEISAMQRGWIVQRGSTVLVELRDRPEDGWWTKTGKPYLAPVIDGDLAAALIAAPPGAIIQTPPDITRDVWFLRTPQRWLKQHGITAHKPLHRLRGLYADDVARVTADAVAARLAGVSAAQAALGHTSSDTTERHYLTQEPSPRKPRQ